MKKLILASCMLLAITGFASAQTSPQTGNNGTAKSNTHQSRSKATGKSGAARKGMMKDSTTTTMHKRTTKKKS